MKFLGIFDERPLIWFHYVLLVAIILIFYYTQGIILYNSIKLIILLFLVISIGDQLIHKILGVD